VENVLYASLAAMFGGPWPAVLVARSMGAGVHPLASGLVVTGWWDARHGRDGGAKGPGIAAGVGLHAVWNGSMVALAVAQTAVRASGASGLLGVASLAFTGALGAVVAAALWSMAGRASAERGAVRWIGASDARAVAGWVLLSASLLVPVTILVVAFPSFYLG
jgi:hypothetical protein